MPAQKIRRQYISLFLLLSALMAVASLFTIYENYSLYRNAQKEELVREAYISNSLLEAVLGDAAKILDVAQPKIEAEIYADALTDESAYRILNASHAAFSTLQSNGVFQLSVYIDEHGMARATSNGVENHPIDLSNRLYFKTLKDNPKLTYAIGNLVIAKTTGLLTFHIAKPLLDKMGKFRGVITQQVAADELAAHLASSLKVLANTQILVNLQGGNVAFMYPDPIEHGDAIFHLSLYIDERIHADGKGSGVVDIAATKGLVENSYIGYVTSTKYGLMTTVCLPEKIVVIDYLKSSSLLILMIAFAYIALAFILLRFYKNGLRLAMSLMVSFTDSLTGLQNRRAFDTEFPKFWKEAQRSQNPISALFIDIDHFKIFNDDYGHDCGDQALIAVAKVIQQYASRPLDFCCRWGGEEFVVLLPETDERGAISLANEILVGVRNIYLNFPNDKHPKITVSIGIATAIVTEINRTDDLVDMADKAMYMAKQGGRDRYSC